MIQFVDLQKDPLFPFDRIPQCDSNVNILIYGAGKCGLALYQQLQSTKLHRCIGFIDRKAEHVKFKLGIPVYQISDIPSLTYDYIVISLYRFQDEICKMLIRHGISESKLIKLGKQNFKNGDIHHERVTNINDYYCFNKINHIGKNISYLELANTEFNWYKGNYKSRCLYGDQSLAQLLMLDLKYANPQTAYHVVDRNSVYIGTLSRTAISNMPQEQLFEDLTLEELCYKLSETDSSDKSISVHMPLCDIMGCFESYGEIELVVIDDFGKLVDVLEARRFFAHFADICADSDEPVVGFVFPYHILENNRSLNKYRYNDFSQNGEDGIIEAIFSKIGFSSKISVEFGAADGIHLSNTRKLLLEHQFSGIFIEGDQQRAHLGKTNYQNADHINFMTGYVGFDKLKTIDEYLHDANVTENPDIMSIDIDSFDYQVWESLKDYRPRVVVIEFNPMTTNHMIFINPKSEKAHMGSSCAALVDLGIRKHYELAAITGCNCIFVIEEEFEKLGIKDNTIEALRPSSTYWENAWMQTYDRNIYHIGFDRFLWKDEKFGSKKFNVPRG